MKRSTGRALAFVCAVAGIAMVVLVVDRATPARASASPAPYVDAALEGPLWELVAAQRWPDTFPASWAAPAVEEVSVAGGGMPALTALGTIALSVGAFELGWKIGRTIDTKWLHLSGDIGTTAVTAAATCTSGIGVRPKMYSLSTGGIAAAMGVPAAWYLNMDWSCDGFSGSAPGSGASQYNDPTCGTQTQKHLDNAAATMIGQLIAQGIGTLVRWNNGRCGSTASNPTGYSLAFSDTQMDGRLIHSAPVPYTDQPVGRTTTIPAPVKNSTNLANARDKITALGPAIQNVYNAALDPTNWARPGPNGSPVGGLITDWTMPDCIGYPVSACQSLITSAATAANNTAPSVTTAVGTGEAARMPGAVLGQSVIAGSSGRPSSTSLTTNPDPLNGFSGGGGFAGGGDTTSGSSDGCDFDDYFGVSWDALRAADPDPARFDEACAEAWQIARNLGIVTATGLDEAWVAASTRLIPGEYLDNDRVINLLTAGGRTMSQWGKYGIRFETPNGPAEVHFYRMNDSTVVNLEEDFKIVFKELF